MAAATCRFSTAGETCVSLAVEGHFFLLPSSLLHSFSMHGRVPSSPPCAVGTVVFFKIKSGRMVNPVAALLFLFNPKGTQVVQ